jgi:hypothetical protein
MLGGWCPLATLWRRAEVPRNPGETAKIRVEWMARQRELLAIKSSSVCCARLIRRQQTVHLGALVAELQALRLEMRNQAGTTDEDLAVVAVRQAISAAEKGETSELLNYLKSPGKWALGLATSIGAGVAADAIKSSLGL